LQFHTVGCLPVHAHSLSLLAEEEKEEEDDIEVGVQAAGGGAVGPAVRFGGCRIMGRRAEVAEGRV
jgi:hypothetical protein